ncbi:N-acetylmuramoyl-L-alanine amidase [Thermomonas sp.]|uniref:N-acetylmuramoyl-L-alanine amidase n=1 Tax=Thermomonas sp. TaxID=1971895 RepID=UPI002636CA00|nr:N-acetylmuramoyl-L-alanine amidase [Thermomonas sp.]
MMHLPRHRCCTLAATFALALLAACTTVQRRNPIATWVPSANFDQRHAVIIVLHYTQQHSVEESLSTLRGENSTGPVSAHYLIGKDGRIFQLVPDGARAWHAGNGRWGTITDLNSASIGIELDNDGASDFAEPQVESLLRLLDDLTTRLMIPKTQVIGHADMAPSRKQDPGPRFPWSRLAAAGYGLWPRGELGEPPAGFDPWLALSAIGYALDDRPAAVRAYREHYRGDRATALDAQDLRILANLAAQRAKRPTQ